MSEARKIKPMNNDDEEVLEREVRIAELLARRAEARLRQLEAERKRAELLMGEERRASRGQLNHSRAPGSAVPGHSRGLAGISRQR